MMQALEASSTSASCHPLPRDVSRTSDSGGGAFLFRARSTNGESGRIFLLVPTDTHSEKKNEPPMFTQLHSLETKRLLAALSVLVETDGPGYIAQTIDMPLYGVGDTPSDAIEMLKAEIESLYNDLMEDDNFSGEWLNRKKLLSSIVA